MFAAIKNRADKMIKHIKNYDRTRRDKKDKASEYMVLQREIITTNDQIRSAYSNFNYATDNDSISYYAYLIKALEMKYALLLKQAKESDGA